jgi:ATP-dependent RNA helicase DDX51/DBP6
MPAPLFKRWAPPKPATQQQSPPPASLPVSSRDAAPEKALSPEAPPPKKEKKSKKRHRDVAEPVAETPQAHSHVDEPMEEDAPAEAPASHQKPKKRKRDSEVAGEQDEDVSKKHKAIFSKFEKASKLAEARGQLEDGQDAEDQQPEEELHGKQERLLLERALR